MGVVDRRWVEREKRERDREGEKKKEEKRDVSSK